MGKDGKRLQKVGKGGKRLEKVGIDAGLTGERGFSCDVANTHVWSLTAGSLLIVYLCCTVGE